MRPFVARMTGPPSWYGLPAKSVTFPPASSMSRTPAAVSHFWRPNSQKPSKRPAATEARSSAAELTGGKCGDFGDVDFFAVERRAFAARGREKLVVERIEDDGGEQRVSLCERDGNAEAGVTVREVRSAVERIDVPAKFRSRSALMARSLFSGNGMVGKVFAQPLDDEPFRAFVRLGDEIHFVAFVGDVQRSRQFFDEDFAGFLGDFNCGFKVAFGHGEHNFNGH